MFGYRLPEDFLIGTANSSFQSEGAWDRDGKTPSVMDHFSTTYAGRPLNDAMNARNARPGCFSTDVPDRGCFFYDNYEAYIEDMQKTGQNTYRLSVSWPRIIPKETGEVNPKGIAFYNKVIDKLLECGITPFVDLCHWDYPQWIMEKDGFENPKFPEWFEAYAKVCFEAFGDRVKLWSTFNEPLVAVDRGYVNHCFPPYREDIAKGQLACHHCILAHYRAVRLYKSMNLGGKIGAVNCITPVSPAHFNEEDMLAVRMQMERNFDWWAEPMLKGRYPQELLERIRFISDNMPEHYQQDLDEWFVPMDFMGLNYYKVGRTQYAPGRTLLSATVESFYSLPGQAAPSYPAGLLDAIEYVAARYGNVELYISENGLPVPNICDEEAECHDPERITYIREHLRMVVRAIRAGYNLKGYYWWNDADSFEQTVGYSLRFGLTWVDHKTGRRRWKDSRHYFSQICKTHMVD